MYNDYYETCSKTYVTLRIYSDKINSKKITEYLNIEPTKVFDKKDYSKNDLSSKKEFNGWFLSSEGVIDSKDFRRHLDYLLDILLPHKLKIKKIASDSVKIDFCCYWKSKDGHGGPTISSNQFLKLSELEIELWFDIY